MEYGGLFGDLPAAKQGGGKQDSSNPQASSPSNNNNSNRSEAVTSALPTKSNKVASKNERQEKPPKASSAASSFFLPAALRKKRKTSVAPAVNINKKTTSESLQPKETTASTFSFATTTIIHQPASSLEPDSSLPVSVHDSGDQDGNEIPIQDEMSSSSIEIPKSKQSSPAALFDDDEIYNPFVPNDLLWVKQQRVVQAEQAREQARMEQVRQEQEMVRQRLMQERQRMQATGDYQGLVHQLQGKKRHPDVGAGRGRGRGVSNVPAWLLERQKQQGPNKEQQQQPGTDTTAPNESTFENYETFL